MKICVTSESTIDLNKEQLEEFGIKTIPFTILLGEKAGLDGVVTPLEIFDYVDKTGVLPKTSAVNETQYEEFFSELLKEYDEIIHIAFSSQLSSACENAFRAAKDNPHIHIIDSKTLSSGIALIAIYAAELVKQGLPVEEIVSKVEARVPYSKASFVVATLDYLYKGGRCSALARLGAQLFRIRPQILVTEEGKMVPGKKYSGKQLTCVENYVDDTLAEYNNPDLSLVFVTHAYASQDMVDAAINKIKQRGFKRVIECHAGSTITSHCGPKCLGILFFNDGGPK